MALFDKKPDDKANVPALPTPPPYSPSPPPIDSIQPLGLPSAPPSSNVLQISKLSSVGF